jgi:hypothetical protein
LCGLGIGGYGSHCVDFAGRLFAVASGFGRFGGVGYA